jgi:hypothetical protein
LGKGIKGYEIFANLGKGKGKWWTFTLFVR